MISLSGSVYIYHTSNNGALWSVTQKLISVDGENGDRFGIRFAMAGNNLAIAASNDDDKGSESGEMICFIKTIILSYYHFYLPTTTTYYYYNSYCII